MSKVNELRQSLSGFRSRTGEPATAIYLGTKNRRELLMSAEISGCLNYGVGKDPRPKFDGVPIYSVDALEHFGIS